MGTEAQKMRTIQGLREYAKRGCPVTLGRDQIEEEEVAQIRVEVREKVKHPLMGGSEKDTAKEVEAISPCNDPS